MATLKSALHSVSRRRFLLLAGLAVAMVIALGGHLVRRRQTVKSFVDTLIPADSYGPSASQLGLDKALMEAMRRDRRWFKFEAAFVWLSLMSFGNFADLSENERNALVQKMEESGRSILWETYIFARNFCFRKYYSEGEHILSMGHVGPPQPEGFEEPWSSWNGLGRG